MREWLKALDERDRKTIGDEIRLVQFGWPVGMPLVRKMEANLWEIRTNLSDRISRVLFTVHAGHAVLLHGFIKKSPKTPEAELQTAKNRLKKLSYEP